MASPICLRLFWHFARAAASRTFCTAGRSRPIRIAMIAITTSNSINVKPRRLRYMVPPFRSMDKNVWANRRSPDFSSFQRNVVVELVRPPLDDGDFLLGFRAPIRRDSIFGDDVGRRWAGNVLRVGRR